MSSRDTVLNRIRGALAADTTPPPPIPRNYIRVGDNPPGSPPVLELMVDRLIDYKAQVREITPDQLPDAIDTALGELRSVVIAPDLDPELAHAAARSGRTITVDGDPGQGRRAITLVPDFHLIVLHADQIVQTVPEAIARLDPLRPLTMIAGPSATSDIELERVEGVHGPRTLYVLIVG